MKSAIELFSALGRRLADFGGDAPTQEVAERACRANGWFTPADVRRAVAAIADGMLRRDRLETWLAPYPVPVAVPRRVLVVIATGSDNANRYFRTQYAGIPALLRGSRQSVAVLSGRETEAQLEGLADDIWAYSGLGCRSVSLLFVPEGYDLRLRMPAVNEKYRNNYRQQKALLTMTGRPFRDLGSAVAVEERAFPAALSRIACSRYKTLGEVEAWLAQHDAELQCVVSECVSHGRRTGFGRAQFPALTDYPDDRDVIAFLAALN